MEKISIVLPTRNRPEGLRRMWQSVKDTSDVMPEIIAYLDEDEKVTAPVAEELGIKYIQKQGPKLILSQCWNAAASIATGNVIVHSSDDFIFRTKGWDTQFLAEFDKYEDKILYVYGDDGYQREKIGTQGAVHRRWIDTVGYLLPPYFEALYVDNWLTDVSSALGRRVYLPSVFIEHIHPDAGKAAVDSTYAEARTRHTRDFEMWIRMQPKLQEDISKLRAVMKT